MNRNASGSSVNMIAAAATPSVEPVPPITTIAMSVTDVLRGDVHVVFVNAASSAGLAQSGQLRVLAVMADERLPEYPDAPTLKELGYTTGKGLWSALYAPAKTPRPILEALHKQVVEALYRAWSVLAGHPYHRE